MTFEPTIIESAAIYGRADRELRREVLVLPTGQSVEPFTVESDEVLWVVMKTGEHRQMLPINPFTDIHGAPPEWI